MRITLLVLAVFTVIVGCKATADRPPSQFTKKNKVELVKFEHDVVFRSGARDPSQIERMKLDAFLSEIQVGPGDAVILDGGLTDQRYALGARLAYKHLSVRQTGEDGTPGRVRVHIERYVVTPPNCPDWSKPMGEDSENTPMAGLGCSNTANLGMMVVNPRDLVRGTTPGPSDGEAVSAAIRRYRTGEITPLVQEESVDYTLSGQR
jgi:pilus biogenesis lipoprotein CpaD